MVGRTYQRIVFCLCVIGVLAPAARGTISPHEVVLVWNSQDPVSKAIRDAYVAARPGIGELDLDLAYEEPANPANPGEMAVTRNFITPASFETHVRRPLLDHLALFAPEAICFVTTRGLPALVTTNFAPGPGHGVENGVVSGFEGALMKLGFQGTTSYPEAPQRGFLDNPYRGAVQYPFSQFVRDECLIGQVFMVSRLDSAVPPGTTEAEAVIKLIERSKSLTVNRPRSVIVIDDTPGGCGTMSRSRAAAQQMRDLGWCVYYDETDAFMHGAGHPADAACGELDVELGYIHRLELVHFSLGVNHDDLCEPNPNRECVNGSYVRDLNAHPAGLYTSVESFNGFSLWGGSPGHGQALDWIGYAGGSFAIAHAYGVFEGEVAQPDEVMLGLYQHGMCWGEAAMSSLVRIGFHLTPIGDPLARVNTTPSVFALCGIPVNAIPPGSWAMPALSGCDFYDELDQTARCHGDLNGDYLVDMEDFVLMASAFPCQCPQFDLDGDGLVGLNDFLITLDWRDVRDIDRDGEVTCQDLFAVRTSECMSDCEPALDFNCDGAITSADWNLIADEIVDWSGIQMPFDLSIDYDGDFAYTCDDLEILRMNLDPDIIVTDSDFDLNLDGRVDCTDEWLYEYWILRWNGEPCEGLGCGECHFTPFELGPANDELVIEYEDL